jgi:hypothetical protein
MRRRIVIASAFIVAPLCSLAGACPMCRDAAAVGSGGGGSPPTGLFNVSVLVILGTFLVVLASIVAKIMGAVRSVNHSVMRQNETE